MKLLQSKFSSKRILDNIRVHYSKRAVSVTVHELSWDEQRVVFLVVQICMTLQMFCAFLCLSSLQDTVSPFHYSEAGQASLSSLGFIILCRYGKTQITGHTHTQPPKGIFNRVIAGSFAFCSFKMSV